MLLRLLGIRKKSRRERIAKRVRSLVPEAPDVDIERLRARVPRKDTGSDSAALSFTGGLLLGLLIGVVVALVLSSQRDDSSSQSRRPTQIKLLPRRDTPGKSEDETQAARG